MRIDTMLTLYKTRFQDGAIVDSCDELPLTPDVEGTENQVVNIYPELEYETLEGFGGALTGSSAHVYEQMSKAQQHTMMELLFSPEQMGYDRVRLHLDSCDFCPEMYEADGDENDELLENFDFSYTVKHIIPMLRDAQTAAGKPLKLFLSPWSPPAYMKTNGERRYGGSLKPEYYERWAEYLCRYIEELRKRGFTVECLSLQNEPKAVQTWDSCVYTAQQERDFLKLMYAALCRHGMESVRLYIWDHNKERCYERASAIIDSETAPMVSGVACHWYSGDHFESLALLRRHFPDKRLALTESCIEYRFYDPTDAFGAAGKLGHELIGDLNHGITAIYDWNVLLDETGGPNHAGNFCLAPFHYDRTTKELRPHLIQKYLYHFAHFLKPGAVRIAISRYTDALDITAWKNPDGHLSVLMLNRTKAALPVKLRLGENICSLMLEAQTIATLVI